MWVYLITVLILFLLYHLELHSKSEAYTNRLFYIGSIAVLFILAFRGDDVGGDTIEYCEYFDGRGSMYGSINLPNEDLGIGFVWISRLIRLLGDDHFFFIFFTSLLTMFPLLYIIKRDSNSKILPLCLYMLTFKLLNLSQTCIRQNISIAFIMIAYIVYTSNYRSRFMNWKYNKYIIVSLILIFAYLCHHTSLVTIPLAASCFFVKFNKKTALVTLWISLFLAMIIHHLIGDMFNYAMMYFSAFQEADLMTRYTFSQYADMNTFSLNLNLPILVLVSLLIYMMDDSDMPTYLTSCLVIGTSLWIFGRTFELMTRVILYCSYLGIAAVPSAHKIKRLPILRMLLNMFLVWYCYKLCDYCLNSDAAWMFDQMVPYNFIFE